LKPEGAGEEERKLETGNLKLETGRRRKRKLETGDLRLETGQPASAPNPEL
jgi:hypothetical protein